MITLEKNFDLGKISLDLHKELNLFGGIVKTDHFKRLERGQGVSGQMTPLKDATIKRKGFNQILVDTDKMRNLVTEKATKTNQQVILHPGNKKKRGKVTSQDIGGFHQEGAGNLPKREWFGITKDVEKRGVKLIEDVIEGRLRHA